MNYHRGPYIQRGSGFGSILGGLFKAALPVLSSVGKGILGSPVTKRLISSGKQAAIDTGVNILSDAIEGRNLRESLQENIGEARSRVAESLRQSRQARTPRMKKRRGISRTSRTSRKRIKRRDIFD